MSDYLTLVSFGNTESVKADGWCPNPPPNCAFFACHKGKCKFIAQQNGDDCSSGASCQPVPTPGGGGFDPEGGEN